MAKVITLDPLADDPWITLIRGFYKKYGRQITHYLEDSGIGAILCPYDHLEMAVLEERNTQIGYYCGNGHWISVSSVKPHDRRRTG